MTEFVGRGMLRQTEAPFRFTKKSVSEMMQPAYQLAASGTDPDTEIEESMYLA